MRFIPDILERAKSSTSNEIIDALRQAAEIIKSQTKHAYCDTDEGQKELLIRMQAQSKPPDARSDANKGATATSLFELDYTAESKAVLCSASLAEEELVEVELTADTGACDTVIPIGMCQQMPVQPSLQSQRHGIRSSKRTQDSHLGGEKVHYVD